MVTYAFFHLYDPSSLQNLLLRIHKLSSNIQPASNNCNIIPVWNKKEYPVKVTAVSMKIQFKNLHIQINNKLSQYYRQYRNIKMKSNGEVLK